VRYSRAENPKNITMKAERKPDERIPADRPKITVIVPTGINATIATKRPYVESEIIEIFSVVFSAAKFANGAQAARLTGSHNLEAANPVTSGDEEGRRITDPHVILAGADDSFLRHIFISFLFISF
jgi:hypothetical protein